MYRIRKQFRFEAAHILRSSYSGCCQNLHGHSYRLEIFITSRRLNEDGMVIDFGEIKDKLKGFLSTIDHSCFSLDEKKDTMLGAFYWKENPTAENMAKVFYNTIKRLLSFRKGIKLEKVRVHETETGWAEYREDE